MPKPPSVVCYCIRNWLEDNRALSNRGRLTLWFDEQALAAWRNTQLAAGPGAPRVYTALALECALLCKSVYHLRLRAAQGFLSSVRELLRLPLPVPDYSTVSRRQGSLQVRLPGGSGSSPRHILIDATGLKIYGAGEWHVWKHRVGRRRTWRKLPLGVEEATKAIVAVDLTESRGHDSRRVSSLLEQIPDPIGQVSGAGAYDTQACYEAVLQRGATPTFIPRCTAQRREIKDATGWRAARNRLLQQIEAQRRSLWRVLSGCTRQSIAEHTRFRFKTLFGGRLWARNLERQHTETRVKCSILIRMTQLCRPEAVRMG